VKVILDTFRWSDPAKQIAAHSLGLLCQKWLVLTRTKRSGTAGHIGGSVLVGASYPHTDDGVRRPGLSNVHKVRDERFAK
jgi:hypothetical protein